MKLTVFTPTYNRAYILEQLYRSLQRQSCQGFEWLIVDDGSTDDTEVLVQGWIAQDNAFPIRYYRQENGGKHRAINAGVKLAQGELFYIVDSDDWLPPDGIQRTIRWAGTLPDDGKERFCGVCGLKAYSMVEVVGTTFSGDWIDCTCLDRDANGISGDKAEAFFTDIMRKYPFPEFEGENFITEAVVWDRMAADGYVLRFFNEIIYLCEYRGDGLTKQGLSIFLRNPRGYGLYLRQCRHYNKFVTSEQLYHEVQFFLGLRKHLHLTEIAELLDRPPIQLFTQAVRYQLRQYVSKSKRYVIKLFRRRP